MKKTESAGSPCSKNGFYVTTSMKQVQHFAEVRYPYLDKAPCLQLLNTLPTPTGVHATAAAGICI